MSVMGTGAAAVSGELGVLGNALHSQAGAEGTQASLGPALLCWFALGFRESRKSPPTLLTSKLSSSLSARKGQSQGTKQGRGMGAEGKTDLIKPITPRQNVKHNPAGQRQVHDCLSKETIKKDSSTCFFKINFFNKFPFNMFICS